MNCLQDAISLPYTETAFLNSKLLQVWIPDLVWIQYMENIAEILINWDYFEQISSNLESFMTTCI